jgi:hypothetical protein
LTLPEIGRSDDDTAQYCHFPFLLICAGFDIGQPSQACAYLAML